MHIKSIQKNVINKEKEPKKGQYYKPSWKIFSDNFIC